ncbi:MAG: MMPL family transporter [Planctomycetaceae bacterium]
MFRPNSEFVQNVRWLEEHVGSIDATEVILELDVVGANRFSNRLDRIAALEQELGQVTGVTSTFSAASIVPQLADPSGIQARLRRTALQRNRARLLQGSHVLAEANREYWRVTLRTPLFGDVDREQLMRNVRATVEKMVHSEQWSDFHRVTYTGGAQLFYETQQDVLLDFASSLLLAFGLILLMMSVALRSLPAGLLSMIPNLVPCVTVFGVLGWIDGGVDIGMTVAGCIALGIAVDDTAHLLLSYRDALREKGKRERALLQAYSHSATAVVQTSAICGISMLPYTFANLVYLSRFGLLIAVLMAAAMIADLVLLPALIASRWGRAFDPAMNEESPTTPL